MKRLNVQLKNMVYLAPKKWGNEVSIEKLSSVITVKPYHTYHIWTVQWILKKSNSDRRCENYLWLPTAVYYPWLPTAVSTYPKLSCLTLSYIIRHYPLLSYAVLSYLWLSIAVSDYPRLSGTICGYLPLSQAILHYHWLSLAILYCLGLSYAV